MSEWTPVFKGLPEKPKSSKEEKTYLVTESGRPLPFVAYFTDYGKWVNPYNFEFPDVIAWMEMPEVYKPKYRWRLNPEGYGSLRSVYLTAAQLALTVAEWDIMVDKSTYKNVFTVEEYEYLADHWNFDKGLFTREEVPEMDKR